MEKLEDLLSVAMAPHCPLVVPMHAQAKPMMGEQRLWIRTYSPLQTTLGKGLRCPRGSGLLGQTVNIL